ncbi:hypothetical protein EDC04DRAFT_2683731 [Pisolithus marmoratus]|nr:hypothetical protein EDC04DRAFT_2683731 [Pisolithus marmoratus]
MRFAFLALFAAPFITAVVAATAKRDTSTCQPQYAFCTPGESNVACCDGLTCVASSTWTGRCEVRFRKESCFCQFTQH